MESFKKKLSKLTIIKGNNKPKSFSIKQDASCDN